MCLPIPYDNAYMLLSGQLLELFAQESVHLTHILLDQFTKHFLYHIRLEYNLDSTIVLKITLQLCPEYNNTFSCKATFAPLNSQSQ